MLKANELLSILHRRFVCMFHYSRIELVGCEKYNNTDFIQNTYSIIIIAGSYRVVHAKTQDVHEVAILLLASYLMLNDYQSFHQLSLPLSVGSGTNRRFTFRISMETRTHSTLFTSYGIYYAIKTTTAKCKAWRKKQIRYPLKLTMQIFHASESDCMLRIAWIKRKRVKRGSGRRPNEQRRQRNVSECEKHRRKHRNWNGFRKEIEIFHKYLWDFSARNNP